MKKNPLLGAHFSTAGRLENAIYRANELGCTVLQLFTKNGRTWQEKQLSKDEIQTFCNTRKAIGIKFVLSHCSYLINIATPDQKNLKKSRAALEEEMLRSGKLEIDYVVLHPGAHLGHGETKGMITATESLNQILDRLLSRKQQKKLPRLLLETTAGQGTCLGKTFEQIRIILNHMKPDLRVYTGVCVDTSHIFAAGFDIRTPDSYNQTIKKLDNDIGLNQVFALHLNDSKTELGSAKDRHEHIEEGYIGKIGFELIMKDPRFMHLPKILETPKNKGDIPMDPVNLAVLTKMTSLTDRDS